MSRRLPEFVDPKRLASQNREYSGDIATQQLARLSDALLESEGKADFQLAFYRDEKRRTRIKGHVRAVLTLQCQRCLEAMDYPVDTDLDLAVITVPEEAEKLPDGCEPVWMEEETLRMLDVVEDELILAIPQIPMHLPDACSTDWENPNLDEIADQDEKDASDTTNPFAVLKGLRSDKE